MNIVEILNDPTFRTVFLGTTSIGAVSGALGCFAYLRRQSLVGDVIAHSSLFGVMFFFLASYLLTGLGNKSLLLLVPGAIFAGVIALVLNQWLLRNTRVREDSSLGIMLAIFFGAGIFLLRWVQRANPPIPGHRGLEGYIFGQAALITQNDLLMIVALGLTSILLMMLFWKELKVHTFDPLFSQSIGHRFRFSEVLLIVLLVVGIVIGIQSIGVVLMIAMLVTPAAAARQWTRSLGAMVSLAALFGAISGGAGSVISATVSNMPTGPTIVLTSVVLFVFSVLFAPRRGLLVHRRKQFFDDPAGATASTRSGDTS